MKTVRLSMGLQARRSDVQAFRCLAVTLDQCQYGLRTYGTNSKIKDKMAKKMLRQRRPGTRTKQSLVLVVLRCLFCLSGSLRLVGLGGRVGSC